MTLAALALAAVITIPPPAEAEDVRPTLALVGGLASPEWVHLGALGRLGPLGASLALGTVGLGIGLTATGRWYLPAPVAGGFFEAGASVVRLAPVSDQTPGDLFPLGFVGLGWQWRVGRWLLDAAIGPPPTSLGGPAFLPTVALNALDLPRMKVDVGYVF